MVDANDRSSQRLIPVCRLPHLAGIFSTTSPGGDVQTVLGSTLKGVDLNLDIPTAQQWNISIERNLPGQILWTTAYVGTRGTHLILQPNLNQASPEPSTVVSRRPHSLFADIDYTDSSGSSSYHSLQVSGEKRMTGGLQFVASYTYSHAIDTGNFSGNRQNLYNLAAERGNGDIDLRHRLVISGTWEIPFGRQRKFGSTMNRALDLAVGGWRLNAIASFYTGLPFTPTSSLNTLNGSGTQPPNRISGGNLPASERTIRRWFDVTAFQTPGLYQFGNAGRNILRGPKTKQADIALAKDFRISDVKRFEFRGEAFNISNTPQFNNPNAAIGRAAAGAISRSGSKTTFQRTSGSCSWR